MIEKKISIIFIGFVGNKFIHLIIIVICFSFDVTLNLNLNREKYH